MPVNTNTLNPPGKSTPTNATSSPSNNTTSSAEKPTHLPPPENLLKKFVSVTNQPPNPTQTIDKPIILKNKETRRHIHRYDLRIGLPMRKNNVLYKIY